MKVLVKGDNDVEGLTDVQRPRRLGPKRANHIIQSFALRKKVDDVRKYVVRREIVKGDKTFYKAPKIQRLITEKRIRRKTVYKQVKKDRWKAGKEAHVAYEKLLSKYLKEKKAAKKADVVVTAPVPAKVAAPVKATKAAAPAKTAAPTKVAAPAKAAAPAKVAAPAKAEAAPDKGKKGGKK